MARVFAILGALGRAYRRDQRSLESVAGNNFFLVTALLLQNAGSFIYLTIGLVLLFPLSTDPLRKVPASRLALWPLEVGAFLLSDLPFTPGSAEWLRAPRFPGRLNQLIRKNLRETVSTLDSCCALPMSLGGLICGAIGLRLPARRALR